DTDVREIVRLILGEILKANYSIDPGFQGTVTIQTSRPLRRDELISTLQGLLTQAGGQLTYQNGIFRVSALGDESSIPPLVGGDSMEAGGQVVTLRYASAKQLAAILETYAGDGVKIVAEPTRNVLVLTGSASARQSVINLIRVFDVDYLAGRFYALFPVKSGDPTKFAANLEAALQIDGDAAALSGAVKIVPIDQANAVMVITRQQDYLDRVTRLVHQLDDVKVTAGRNIHVYYLKNTQPLDLQPLLQRAVNPSSNSGATEEAAPGNLPPTSTPTTIGSMASAGGPATGGATPAAAGTGTTLGQTGTATTQTPTPSSSSTNTSPQQAGAGNPNGPQ